MKINIDIDEIRMVFEHGSTDVNYYLDSATGKILAEIDEPFYLDGTPAERDIIEDFWSENFPENSRYIEIPVIEELKSASEINQENHKDMQAFVNVIEDKNLKQQLQKVIDLNYSSDHALQQFLEVMKRRPQRKLWLLFREQQQDRRYKSILETINERIVSFLDDQNIECSP